MKIYIEEAVVDTCALFKFCIVWGRLMQSRTGFGIYHFIGCSTEN